MRRIITVSVAVVSLLVATTAPAWATLADTHFRFGTIQFVTDGPDDNKIDGTITHFQGYIKAEHPAKCLPNRAITIKKKQNGVWILFGTGTTDATGFWSVNGSQYEGKYEFIVDASHPTSRLTCIHDFVTGYAY